MLVYDTQELNIFLSIESYKFLPHDVTKDTITQLFCNNGDIILHLSLQFFNKIHLKRYLQDDSIYLVCKGAQLIRDSRNSLHQLEVNYQL